LPYNDEMPNVFLALGSGLPSNAVPLAPPRLLKILLAKVRCLRLSFRSMESSAEYLIVSASLRSKSRSRVLAHYLADCFRMESVPLRLIDLRECALPFCDGESAYSHPEVLTLSKSIFEARVVILATPIYNFDASSAVKNLIELTGDSWDNKIVGFLCAAGGSLSYMAVMSLANSLMLDFRCLIIPRFVFATADDFEDWTLSSALVRERIRQLAVASTRIRNDQVPT
jgi:NAD(P)H-dependent FMN reductase